MDKRTLAKTPLRDAPPDAMSQAKRIKAVKAYISAEIVVRCENRILLLNIYLKSDLRKNKSGAAYRVFLDKEDYITQDLRSKGAKWLTGRLTSVLDTWNLKGICAFADDASHQAVIGYFENGQGPFEALDDFQNRVLEKRLMAKHKKITDIIDAKMALVPELPGDWEEWLEKTAIPDSRYIYYDYKKGKTVQKGRCTYCNAAVEVEKPRYGKEGICPECGIKIIFKSCKKAGSSPLPDWGEAAIIQRVGDEIAVRYFRLTRQHYPLNQERSVTIAHEVSRDFFGNDGYAPYEWRKFKMTQVVRWCEGEAKYYLRDPVMYEKNINEVINGTLWQYSALHQYATRHPGASVNVFRFFYKYREYPFIEYLVKLKLYRLVKEVLSGYADHVNKAGKNLSEILGVGKELLPLLQEIDADDNGLSLIQAASKAGYKLTADEFRRFVEKYGHKLKLFKMTCYATIHRLTRYIDEQGVSQNRNNVFRDFSDYIDYCDELGYDLKNEFVLFPNNLKKAHDFAYNRVLGLREQKKKAYREQLNTEAAQYFAELQERYRWEYDAFIVTAPASLFEIIKEGQKLHHCVGAHAERAAKGEIIILFLRKRDAPAKPFYTIEIKSGQVTQCRGRNNCDMPEEIKEIINAFSTSKVQPQMRRKAVTGA